MSRLNVMSFVIIAMAVVAGTIFVIQGEVKGIVAAMWCLIAIIAHLQLIGERSK